jgi:hypothetical protein
MFEELLKEAEAAGSAPSSENGDLPILDRVESLIA